MAQINYTRHLIPYQRRQTHQLSIGKVTLGSDFPIRIQSMCNTDTMDVAATVAQSIRMIKAGADYVRITAPNCRAAEQLAIIKQHLQEQGYETPLIADIHFQPEAAETAARHVDKIRINPGNFISRNRAVSSIDAFDYQMELDTIAARFMPLIEICRKHATAMRIGTNHGSLSDRIIARYGDTPEGMAEATMEYLRMCRKADYSAVVISLKASNTRILVQATRLLVAKMEAEAMTYPLHVGVTEAGDAEAGRIKSAAGIAALLSEGLGDTIRVSLSEPPEAELPIARFLADFFAHTKIDGDFPTPTRIQINPFDYQRRKTHRADCVGADLPPVVVCDLFGKKLTENLLNRLGYFKDHKQNTAPEYLLVSKLDENLLGYPNVRFLTHYGLWVTNRRSNVFPCMPLGGYFSESIKSDQLNVVLMSDRQLLDKWERVLVLKDDPTVVLLLEITDHKAVTRLRALFNRLIVSDFQVPVILRYTTDSMVSAHFQWSMAACAGPLFLDGLPDGLCLLNNELEPVDINQTAFSILQAVRVRQTQTEYITCPTCGRTKFDMPQTIARVKEATKHLTHLKIGIMGCIVNGPGEMADADYGYVGAGPGKINLYKGKVLIKKQIDESLAVRELIKLINEGE